TKTDQMLIHHSAINKQNEFIQKDQYINFDDAPDHQQLCDNEQAYFLNAIAQQLDLTDHLQQAISSLQIALACDESVKTGKTVLL
ncbi:MAG: gfo/Idh/MocA family oxidoreductase, partial [Flavobacteriaceae bacterium]